MIDELVYYIDNSAPAIVRRLSTQGGRTLNIEPGMNFRIKARPIQSDNIVLDESMTVDLDEDTVTYQPDATDFATEGVYKAWISVNLGGSAEQDTDEFIINVYAHHPGQGTRVGTIYEACHALVPVAWNTVRGLPNYGDLQLQRLIELAKLRVLPSPVAITGEASLDPRVIDYIAKKVLVDHVLETAIDFWRNEVIARTVRSNSEEVETYPDRIRALEKQLERFRLDLANQESELQELIGATGTLAAAPALDIVAPLLTPGLESMAPMYADPSCDDWFLA
jgi:hypothetical protein